ncbi:hypothetical protein OE88DRAFT_1663058 [Heliocybe sulcata]|uniref:Uncharacterized protein n=1 Tax=Heliocybe sulcata TaxID=5364 RepID=A0A5C3MVW2_9AGAM|nr:hypothetical protein OE88DRAFT_1663058 [Heliocybe sulcata]
MGLFNGPSGCHILARLHHDGHPPDENRKTVQEPQFTTIQLMEGMTQPSGSVSGTTSVADTVDVELQMRWSRKIETILTQTRATV